MARHDFRNNRYASLRASYDMAFAVFCHARRELDTRCEDNVMENVVLRLQKDFEASQAVYRGARNRLAMCLLERRYPRQRGRASHGKLIVGSPANRSIIPARTGRVAQLAEQLTLNQ